MAGHNTIKPSYSIPNHTTPGHHINITTKTSSFNVKNTTIILSSSTVSVINNKSPNPKSGDLDMLFTLVFIACVVLALLLVISLFMVIVCWKVKKRRRTANLTEVRKGDGKERKRGRVNLRNSIKRVFVSDGPLYAVSNLNNSRCYTGIPEATQNNPNIDSARSSPEPEIVIQANEPDEISKDKVNDHVIYQRYLSPIEGVPSSPSSASSVAKEREDQTYLQPIDELRASKRFLDRSKNSSPEPEVAYLEPLHGIPEPDEVHQKPYKPVPSPKPKVKPKP